MASDDAVAVGTAARGALGKFGEQVAVDHLLANGLTVLERNWRCRDGEVDIIAVEGDVLVMCEVRPVVVSSSARRSTR